MTETVSAGRPRTAMPREDRFQQILLAAADAYARHGYHQTSVKTIAERAGVAIGTYYLYFSSKEASCLAIIDRLYELVMAAVVEARAGHQGTLAKLTASVRAVLHTFGSHEDLAKVVLIQAPGAHPDFDRRLREIHAELTALVARDVREAIEASLLPSQDERLAARCLVGSLYEILLGWLRDRDPSDLAQAAPTLLTFIFRGLGAEVVEG